VTTCAHCGRSNDPGSRFCMDCGKPLSASAMAVAFPMEGPGLPATRVYPTGSSASSAAPQCSLCGHEVDGTMPFCPHCGTRLEAAVPSPTPSCRNCGLAVPDPAFKFCPNCATPLVPGDPASASQAHTAVFSAQRASLPPVQLVVVSEDGARGSTHSLVGVETTVGRSGADISFPDDTYLSPMHALILWKDGKLSIRDLGSRNGTWVFLSGPHRLVDGDLILIGSQLLRFRRLGYPGPHPPEADATRRMGSFVPSADIACLTQLRADGSERDTFHLSPGRDIALGRDKGDWVFPYDKSMSGTHAAVKSEDADFVLQDAGSRNGVAVAVRGDHPLPKAAKILVGDKLLMVETS
jgi:pSer/pThr/pTyr-binding forkhead associated (FHA) protein